MTETMEISIAEKSLAYATRQELINELCARNMGTVLMFDALEENEAGIMEVKTACVYSGPLTELYGLLDMHGRKLKHSILCVLNDCGLGHGGSASAGD